MVPGTFIRHANPENIEEVLRDHQASILQIANASGSLTTTGKGAISALPNKREVEELLRS
ncbi:hypothetical protein [Neobacillus niacini]|uniref:hypothetical protein n=1 Tax=Neobacillus niacini TaxID=86668 RepID=UPI00286A08CD|nr:hypothetical protein [Neobacillus niacini]